MRLSGNSAKLAESLRINCRLLENIMPGFGQLEGGNNKKRHVRHDIESRTPYIRSTMANFGRACIKETMKSPFDSVSGAIDPPSRPLQHLP